MRFANPQMLWLLAVTAPLLIWFLYWAWGKKQKLITQFVQSRLLAQLTVGVSPLRQKIRLALLAAAVGSAFLALARPQWGLGSEEVKQRGLDILVAIDTSRSMLATDVRPNRIARAKLAALDLMRLSKSDRLGLVAFAGDAFLQCPLTLDETAFRQSLDALEVGIIPQGGTALTSAIETALTAFKSEGDNFKILVLFTDGEDHESDALQAAKNAATAGLRIFTIGVGTPSGELLNVTDENGVTSYIKDSQGNAVKSRLDEALLREIATVSRGSYLPLRGAKAIETLYERELAPLPKSDISSRLIHRYRERFQWPLALAILFLLLEMLLPERRRVQRSETIIRAANAELRRAVAALLVVLFPCTLFASPSDAKRLYENGKYKEAQLSYESLLEKSGHNGLKGFDRAREELEKGREEAAEAEVGRYLDKGDFGDRRLHFNAGAAAYKAGDLESALMHFALAATAPDLKLQERAYYNLGNAQYRRGEHQQEASEKIESWENSVQGFEAALKLDPQDADARHNLEFVKKKLEEFKQQQAKQQSNQPKQKEQDQKKEDQKDPRSDPSKGQQQQPDKRQDRSKEDSAKPDQPKELQEPKSEPDNKPENAANDQQKPQNQADQNQKKGSAGEKPDDRAEARAEPAPAGQMTVQQAQQLLDAQKGEEKALIFVPARRPESKNRVFKDW